MDQKFLEVKGFARHFVPLRQKKANRQTEIRHKTDLATGISLYSPDGQTGPDAHDVTERPRRATTQSESLDAFSRITTTVFCQN